jgi:signal transduction histidine kinase
MRVFLPRTIQARLILSHLLVSLISVALIASYAGYILISSARLQVLNRYKELIHAAANETEGVFVDFRTGQASDEQLHQTLVHAFANRPEVHYTIYLPDGSPLLDSSGTLPPPATPQDAPELWQALNTQSGEGDNFRRDGGQGEKIYLAMRLTYDEQVYGVLRIDAPLEAAAILARSSLGLLVASALIVGLGTSVIGYFLARSMAGPVERITQMAESLAGGQMNVRVDPHTHIQEMNRLAEAFNNMATRLQVYVDELRSFVANASHELRTPLTSIKLRVEALRSGALDDPPVTERFLAEVEGEVDRMTSMVNDLLDLSRIEAGLNPAKRVPVDLATVANDVYEAFKARAERAGIKLGASIQSGLPPVLGNEDQLRRVLYNLMDNAIKYTASGGQVQIVLAAGQRNGTILLKVSDTGFGIAPAHLPHIFERFYRVEATRPRFGPSQGSGLGLPIAKSIAEAHYGQIGVSSKVGQGTTFWVELPISKAPLA